jgi:uncharacterized protein DUF5317
MLGGHLGGFLRAPLAWLPLLLGSFGLELLLYDPPINQQPWAMAVGPWMWVASRTAMLVMLARNAQVDGPRRLAWATILLGVGLNSLVLAVNGGHMPQSQDAAAEVWGSAYVRPEAYGTQLENIAWMNASTRLASFGDVFPEPRWLPLANVLSPGDLILALGVALWAFAVTRQDRVPMSSIVRQRFFS